MPQKFMKKVDKFRKKERKKFLIPRIWQDSFWRGFIFAISTGKYEKISRFKRSQVGVIFQKVGSF